jgi:hypothetical protein
MQLAGKLEDIMSSTMLQSPVNEEGMHAALSFDSLMENVETDSVASIDSNESCSSDAQASTMGNTVGSKQGHVKDTEKDKDDKVASSGACCSAEYVYTAPCEHHPSKGQTDYLVNDMFPKLKASAFPLLCLHALLFIILSILFCVILLSIPPMLRSYKSAWLCSRHFHFS